MPDPASIHITSEVTPNPNSMRFVVNQTFLETGTVDYPDAKSAKESPLASRLFKTDGVAGVLVGKNFITVTKFPGIQWDEFASIVVNEIRSGLLNNEIAVPESNSLEAKSQKTAGKENPVVEKIKRILDDEIRPAVTMDGGDIQFIGYDNGIVSLRLQGACSHCPSATLTLKMGVENRLRAEIPEIREVVQG